MIPIKDDRAVKNQSLAKSLFLSASLLCLTPWISSGQALLLGLILALSLGNPFADQAKMLTHKFLSLAVIGLGAGMNLNVVGEVGLHGIGYTVLGIASAFLIGTTLGKLLKTERNTSLLITMGTAICGGSAIAAVAPVIKAKHHEVTVALGTVFTLNAIALFIFPWVGHHLSLSESQFGLWSALAIHDTSSVVGATLQYGSHALEVGTTVKLARALWIIPVAALIGFIRSKENADVTGTTKARRPWFILGFILVAALVTWLPGLQPAGHLIEQGAKHLMVLTLFLIGSGLSRAMLRDVGFRPFIQGIGLWAIMAGGSLAGLYLGFIEM